MRGRRWAVAAALLAAGCGGSPRGLAGARGVLADPGRFDTASQAARAFAEVSEDLFRAGTQCQRDHGQDAPACAPVLEAAGFAQVMAANALRCTQAPLQQTRADLAKHLAEPGSTLPSIPTCT
jgi:hypothetical protein